MEAGETAFEPKVTRRIAGAAGAPILGDVYRYA
jgi:hypothetical protein